MALLDPEASGWCVLGVPRQPTAYVRCLAEQAQQKGRPLTLGATRKYRQGDAGALRGNPRQGPRERGHPWMVLHRPFDLC